MHVRDPANSAESSSAARSHLLRAAAVALLAALAGCRVPARHAVESAPEVAANGPRYRIDAARSELRILVYRAGALARLGHNHVLISRALEGRVSLAAPGVLAGAAFEVRVPLESLAVDEADARREEGEEFASQPSAADIEGTRRNLLGSAVLNAAACPAITARGSTEALEAGVAARAQLEVCEAGASLHLPLEAAERDGALTIRGGFSLRQTQLGLVPFSVALGALTVRDQLEVRFRIVAVPDA